MIEHAAVETALADLRELVAADGGDVVLEAVDGDTARVRLVLDTAECRECVLPKDMLERVALDVMQPTVPDLETVVIDDPRVARGGTDA